MFHSAIRLRNGWVVNPAGKEYRYSFRANLVLRLDNQVSTGANVKPQDDTETMTVFGKPPTSSHAKSSRKEVQAAISTLNTPTSFEAELAKDKVMGIVSTHLEKVCREPGCRFCQVC